MMDHTKTGAVIVTGATGGIGKATVLRLLDRGMSVFVIDIDEKSLDAMLGDVGTASGRLDGCRADVINEEQITQAINLAAQRFGNIYGLVHVAGGAGPKRALNIEDFQLHEWAHVIDLNLTSAFLATRAAVPLMRKNGSGRIILFSSISADGQTGPLTTVTGRLPYATSKAALLGFTSQLAKDVADANITVNALMPGLILGEPGTRIRDKFDNLPPEHKAAMLDGIPSGKPGSGDDVAAAVEFLLSPSAGFVSGVALPVDGAFR